MCSSDLACNGLSTKYDLTAFIKKGARNTVNERSLSRTIWSNEPEAFTLFQGEADPVECCEATKVFRDLVYFEEDFHRFTRPTIPSGAATTKTTNNKPTTRTFNSLEIVTVTICWRLARRMAPMTGPIQ